MKAYRGVEAQIHVLLTSAPNEDESSASFSGRFTPRRISLCTHWTVGSVGRRAGLKAVAKK